jgi:hypothetical protein
MDSSVIYESIENNECEQINVISNNTENANQFCANNCQIIIKTLNKEVIDLENKMSNSLKINIF